MSEVEATCDRVGIIRDGELATIDTISHLTELSLWTVEIAFAEPIDEHSFDGLQGVSVGSATDRAFTLSVSGDGSMDAVIKAASKHHVASFQSEHASLEDAFLKYYSDSEFPKTEGTPSTIGDHLHRDGFHTS